MSGAEWKPRTRALAGLAALLALAALTVVSLLAVLPPAPRRRRPGRRVQRRRGRSSTSSASGPQVHVAGSAGRRPGPRLHRDRRCTELGLQTEVQDAVGAEDALGGFGMARVRNVVAVLPGTASTGRVFLFAHYDSVQVSYGGNDDGAGVATLLETARALTSGPRPRNDIVFVFTDAEEACLCGAEAFVNQHRWRPTAAWC